MMLNTDFPKVFAVIPIVKIEFNRVLVESIVFRMQLDEKFFPFETDFTYFRPGKRIDFRIILKNQNAHVCHGQV